MNNLRFCRGQWRPYSFILLRMSAWDGLQLIFHLVLVLF